MRTHCQWGWFLPRLQNSPRPRTAYERLCSLCLHTAVPLWGLGPPLTSSFYFISSSKTLSPNTFTLSYWKLELQHVNFGWTQLPVPDGARWCQTSKINNLAGQDWSGLTKRWSLLEHSPCSLLEAGHSVLLKKEWQVLRFKEMISHGGEFAHKFFTLSLGISWIPWSKVRA